MGVIEKACLDLTAVTRTHAKGTPAPRSVAIAVLLAYVISSFRVSVNETIRRLGVVGAEHALLHPTSVWSVESVSRAACRAGRVHSNLGADGDEIVRGLLAKAHPLLYDGTSDLTVIKVLHIECWGACAPGTFVGGNFEAGSNTVRVRDDIDPLLLYVSTITGYPHQEVASATPNSKWVLMHELAHLVDRAAADAVRLRKGLMRLLDFSEFYKPLLKVTFEEANFMYRTGSSSIDKHSFFAAMQREKEQLYAKAIQSEPWAPWRKKYGMTSASEFFAESSAGYLYPTLTSPDSVFDSLQQHNWPTHDWLRDNDPELFAFMGIVSDIWRRIELIWRCIEFNMSIIVGATVTVRVGDPTGGRSHYCGAVPTVSSIASMRRFRGRTRSSYRITSMPTPMTVPFADILWPSSPRAWQLVHVLCINATSTRKSFSASSLMTIVLMTVCRYNVALERMGLNHSKTQRCPARRDVVLRFNLTRPVVLHCIEMKAVNSAVDVYHQLVPMATHAVVLRVEEDSRIRAMTTFNNRKWDATTLCAGEGHVYDVHEAQGSLTFTTAERDGAPMFALMCIVPGFDGELNVVEACATYTDRERAERHCELTALAHGEFYHVVELPALDAPPAELAKLDGDHEAMRAAIIARKNAFKQRAEEVRTEARRTDKFAAELRSVVEYAKGLRRDMSNREAMSEKLSAHLAERCNGDVAMEAALNSAGELVLG
ncbi:hypothetical protein JKP88DRAFT_251012 [Tribonema minus]|uniref:Uncharacterized protein n=1 Tax=Tribonema minus TaxID=303371 RepID=A0A835ZEF9_9STRA|nr:hypothetical protein JKP88DRAFT_251012 [Tribonema minus]